MTFIKRFPRLWTAARLLFLAAQIVLILLLGGQGDLFFYQGF